MATSVPTAEDVQQALHHPLSFVHRALCSETSKHAPILNESLTGQAISNLHQHLAISNWGVEVALEKVLGLHEPRNSPSCKLASIPSLNDLGSTRDISHLRPGQLVRFRGMVQETLQPEIYAGLYQALSGEHKENEPQPFTAVSFPTLKQKEQEQNIGAVPCVFLVYICSLFLCLLTDLKLI
jgi:hypothetical protein